MDGVTMIITLRPAARHARPAASWDHAHTDGTECRGALCESAAPVVRMVPLGFTGTTTQQITLA